MDLTEKERLARTKVAYPLDNLKIFRTRDETPYYSSIESRVRELSPVVGLFKIGKETFTRFGPDAIKLVQDNGSDVFLDLKYHDIPTTVGGAVDAATKHAVYVLNVHAAGTRPMLLKASESAKKAAQDYNIPQAKVVAVTVLTSIGPAEYLEANLAFVPRLTSSDLTPYMGMRLDDHDRQRSLAKLLLSRGYDHLVSDYLTRCTIIEDTVKNMAHLAACCSLDGIVCAAADLKHITESLPEDFFYITPGIKGPSTDAGIDQVRIDTPGNAIKNGSSIIVVGRAISGGKTPEERLERGYEILWDMARYL